MSHGFCSGNHPPLTFPSTDLEACPKAELEQQTRPQEEPDQPFKNAPPRFQKTPNYMLLPRGCVHSFSSKACGRQRKVLQNPLY